MDWPKRTITLHVSYDPPISGYGGYDEYTIGPLNSEQIDYVNKRIHDVIKAAAKAFKVEGGWTGVE